MDKIEGSQEPVCCHRVGIIDSTSQKDVHIFCRAHVFDHVHQPYVLLFLSSHIHRFRMHQLGQRSLTRMQRVSHFPPRTRLLIILDFHLLTEGSMNPKLVCMDRLGYMRMHTSE